VEEKRFGVRFHYEGGYTFDCMAADRQLGDTLASAMKKQRLGSITVSPSHMPIYTAIELKGCVKIERIEALANVVVTEILWEIDTAEDIEIVEVTLRGQ
jgi:hypothetical protein